MPAWQEQRLTNSELYALFDRLFPRGFAGADVLAELAPEGWEHSPLVACFHPSVERIFEERLQIHRNLMELRRIRGERGDVGEDAAPPEPTLDDVRHEYQPQPVQWEEELTELVADCLWDVFSDNHEVVMANGRIADIGSFRGAAAFLDEYVSGSRGTGREGDHLRFYMGTIWIRERADLMSVYAMILRRLKALGADWAFHFPELGLVELGGDADVSQLRAELSAMNARAREAALDRLPPATVRAYRRVYGRDPRGWPPA